jgi:GTPase SAR1 family protein
MYLYKTDGIIIMYDINSKDSLNKIDELIKFINEKTKNMYGMVFIGNKTDLKKKNDFIKTVYIKSFLENQFGKRNIQVFEVSVKNNRVDDLNNVFSSLIVDTNQYSTILKNKLLKKNSKKSFF